MNKYEEAFEYLVSSYPIYYAKVSGRLELITYARILHELVEKEKKLKPKYIKEHFGNGFSDVEMVIKIPVCPMCGKRVSKGNCCSNNECRQAIDWNKDE